MKPDEQMGIEGRFVCRSRMDGSGDLILGSMFKSQTGLLRPDVVYEIVNIMGELLIRPVGPAAINSDGSSRHLIGASWMNAFGEIPSMTGGRHLLTIEEVAELAQQNASKDQHGEF